MTQKEIRRALKNKLFTETINGTVKIDKETIGKVEFPLENAVKISTIDGGMIIIPQASAEELINEQTFTYKSGLGNIIGLAIEAKAK